MSVRLPEAVAACRAFFAEGAKAMSETEMEELGMENGSEWRNGLNYQGREGRGWIRPFAFPSFRHSQFFHVWAH
jgi:hypothetical protein